MQCAPFLAPRCAQLRARRASERHAVRLFLLMHLAVHVTITSHTDAQWVNDHVT